MSCLNTCIWLYWCPFLWLSTYFAYCAGTYSDFDSGCCKPSLVWVLKVWNRCSWQLFQQYHQIHEGRSGWCVLLRINSRHCSCTAAWRRISWTLLIGASMVKSGPMRARHMACSRCWSCGCFPCAQGIVSPGRQLCCETPLEAWDAANIDGRANGQEKDGKAFGCKSLKCFEHRYPHWGLLSKSWAKVDCGLDRVPLAYIAANKGLQMGVGSMAFSMSLYSLDVL